MVGEQGDEGSEMWRQRGKGNDNEEEEDRYEEQLT